MFNQAGYTKGNIFLLLIAVVSPAVEWFKVVTYSNAVLGPPRHTSPHTC